jgi:uncharacterized membrane protein
MRGAYTRARECGYVGVGVWVCGFVGVWVCGCTLVVSAGVGFPAFFLFFLWHFVFLWLRIDQKMKDSLIENGKKRGTRKKKKRGK